MNNAREAMQQADDWLGIPQVRSAGPTAAVWGPRAQCGEVACPRTLRLGGQLAPFSARDR